MGGVTQPGPVALPKRGGAAEPGDASDLVCANGVEFIHPTFISGGGGQGLPVATLRVGGALFAVVGARVSSRSERREFTVWRPAVRGSDDGESATAFWDVTRSACPVA